MGTSQFETAMRRALALSEAVWGATSPNPPVGAVILDRDGRTVGEGATSPPGGPHAEALALARAGDHARNATAVVTLEPCRHTGRTGPCTQTLLAAGVSRVVYAVPDPTPQAGGGAAELTDAGVEVIGGVLDDVVRSGPLEAWLSAQRTGRPFVTWKLAATLDGRSAAADGTSQWITSEAARADVHRLRAQSDAVLVGVGTVLADDPALTVRAVSGDPEPLRQPLRVVLDNHGRTPPGAAVHPAWVLPGNDLLDVLDRLHRHGVVSVLVEGGPTVAAAFLRAGLVDRVVAYLAPVLLGAGPAALGDIGVGTISDATRLRLDDVTVTGGDVRLTLRPAPRLTGRTA
ncbi:MAG: bifunctional diaminohydroxyphosphoribosylaminopyrimidine deaminase/5-amino-6-(5-phosphoribosylamino)uracil reductase RibD [Actinomycetota bacterium]|nr:bifunctional diaminohydroxyphosphoribosylaminopyrimidine deaminase/5-amino-6-(5-phosphoribosylamino)uracil reductase RibD [Actinomycetota bacterium]